MRVPRSCPRSKALRQLGGGCALMGLLLSLTGGALPGSPELTKPERIIWGARGTPFQQPLGIAIDSTRGEIVVANTGAHRIEIVSYAGRSLARFVHRVAGPGGKTVEGTPRCVAVGSQGRYLVTDQLAPDVVDVLDRSGRSQGQIGVQSSRSGAPGALYVSRDGDLWVGGPPGDDRIYRFDSAARPRSTWGVSGNAPGHLHAITAIATLPTGDVVVACAQTQLAVQIFTAAGAFRLGFGLHDLGPGNFSLPSGVVTTGDGRIWVSDELRQIIQVFGPEGNYLGAFGGLGLAPGDFAYPSALASDGHSRMAVAERESGRVQLLQILEGGDETPSEPDGAGPEQENRFLETRVDNGSKQKGETP